MYNHYGKYNVKREKLSDGSTDVTISPVDDEFHGLLLMAVLFYLPLTMTMLGMVVIVFLCMTFKFETVGGFLQCWFILTIVLMAIGMIGWVVALILEALSKKK